MNEEGSLDYRRAFEIAYNDSKPLCDQEVLALEKILEDSPDDLDSRFRLIGHYTLRGIRSAEAIEPRLRHVLWMIDNHPGHPLLRTPVVGVFNFLDEWGSYAQVQERWLEFLESEEVSCDGLINAAHFFLCREKALAERCLLRAKELYSDSEEVQNALEHLNHLWRRCDCYKP